MQKKLNNKIILFSFLYWNEETEESAFDNFKNDNYKQEIIKSNLNPVVYNSGDYKLKLSEASGSESVGIAILEI